MRAHCESNYLCHLRKSLENLKRSRCQKSSSPLSGIENLTLVAVPSIGPVASEYWLTFLELGFNFCMEFSMEKSDRALKGLMLYPFVAADSIC